MSNSNYQEICDDIARSECTPRSLNIIKEKFRCDIDSVRTYDKIRSLKSLLKVLEKRDCLNEENITPLRTIVELLNRDDLDSIARLDNYSYSTIRSVNTNNIHPYYDRVPVLNAINPDPIERIFDVIGEEIGHKWKDLARHLNIPEGAIDNFDFMYGKNIPRITREVLLNHKSASDKKYWKLALFAALDKSRRQDLRIKVQTILAANAMI